jgi:protein SCO1
MRKGYSLHLFLSATALMTALAGCGRDAAKEVSTSTVAAPAATPGEERHPMTGEIVKVDTANGILHVAHDDIPGYMPAMTMEFKVGKSDLANARVGQRIRAELVDRKGDYFLEKIWPDDAATKAAIEAAAKLLAQDTAMRGKEVYREIGENAPEFTLLDQEGRTTALSRFRGKQVLLNFIFTRCPIATMCPAATQRMMQVQAAAKKANAVGLELVSITLDPDYDTPGVLKDYAAVRGIDTANFTFLTGPDTAVRHLLAQLGVLREFEGNTIKHSLATVLINEDGKIVHRVDGSVWQVEDFVERMRKG